jgi:hypothetical protein
MESKNVKYTQIGVKYYRLKEQWIKYHYIQLNEEKCYFREGMGRYWVSDQYIDPCLLSPVCTGIFPLT